jgi:hypothetical protein
MELRDCVCVEATVSTENKCLACYKRIFYQPTRSYRRFYCTVHFNLSCEKYAEGHLCAVCDAKGYKITYNHVQGKHILHQATTLFS